MRYISILEIIIAMKKIFHCMKDRGTISLDSFDYRKYVI
ncbi:hypothetical protein HMPREF9715_00462 [Myroides odoratimimus CIP 101113]|uniref:Uncharacterized protein n=1 Tax=Myroides odoratimimus CIP 101113 TaxID=883154 RepID=A0AAV3F782_9FLAO|nr:hypothetical protein HMPREF9715_00462 [Myroides odoratimimus CIP 101113]SHM70044.1 hypothetical protein SAMN05444275_12122 [Myroides odoratimimus subsp. xuanwuensis]